MTITELSAATDDDLRRIEALRALLRDHDGLRDTSGRVADRISIYCYRDSWGGVRIGEIGLSWDTYPDGRAGSFGSSWMASDLDAFPVIYAAEQYLNACLLDVEDHGHGALYDAEQEARRGLLYWLMPDQGRDYNALPEWEERERNPLTTTQLES